MQNMLNIILMSGGVTVDFWKDENYFWYEIAFFLGSSGVLSVRLRRQQRVCNHKDTVLSPTLAPQSPTPNTMSKDINQPNKPLGDKT